MKIIERGTIDSDNYCEIVGDSFSYSTVLFPDCWILEKDGATPHTSRQTIPYFTSILYKYSVPEKLKKVD